jgi:hypothetical protein
LRVLGQPGLLSKTLCEKTNMCVYVPIYMYTQVYIHRYTDTPNVNWGHPGSQNYFDFYFPFFLVVLGFELRASYPPLYLALVIFKIGSLKLFAWAGLKP